MSGLTDKAVPDKKYDLLWLGIDVGSTTVKVIVVDDATDQILWQDYQRHDTKQPEKALEMLKRIEADLPGTPQENYRAFITGSGGSTVGKHVGAKFVQEVNAVSLAVEKLYPECGSVIELGGQDAKIIIFKEDPETGKKKKLPSMNDKCAGGTGAVIDKINAKLRIPTEELCNMGYEGLRLHPVAGKCGVFAETDINSLQKQGVPPPELMASLFESIIQQNLSVLTRGNTLRPTVLLLGGPNCYIKGMRDCWKSNIPKIWEERNYPLPEGVDPKELIKTPDNAQYFACIGAIEYGKSEDPGVGALPGLLQAGVVHHRGPHHREGQEGRRRGAGQDSGRVGRIQGEVQEASVHAGEVRDRAGGGRLHRHRRRLDLHQGRAGGQEPQYPVQDLPALQGQSDRGHAGSPGQDRQAGHRPGRNAQSARRRHHRLCQGHPQGCRRRRRGAGRDRGPYAGCAALLS